MMQRTIATIGLAIALLTFTSAQEDQAAQENRFGLQVGTGFYSSTFALSAGIFYDMPRDEQSWFRAGLSFTTYKFDMPPWSSLTLTGFTLTGGYYQYFNAESNIYWGLGFGVAQTRISGTGFLTSTSTGAGAYLTLGYKFSANMFAELDFAGGVSRLGGAALTVGMFF